MQINLLFKHDIDETVEEEHLSQPSKRVVFHHHHAGADNNESPVLSLADIHHVHSSNGGSECYDPVKALLVSPGVHEGRGRETLTTRCSPARESTSQLNSSITTWAGGLRYYSSPNEDRHHHRGHPTLLVLHIPEGSG